MNLLAKEFLPLILTFAPLFTKPVWESALILLVGAIVAPGKRTVSAILQVMGLHHESHFQNYHRVLNRAIWSSRQASRLLLQQLVKVFAPSGVLVMGIDDTTLAAMGQTSSDSHFVKTSGWRWLSLMLLVQIPWALACLGTPVLHRFGTV